MVADHADFFSDLELCENPYPYFDELREKGPVSTDPVHGVAMVTTLEGALGVFNDAVNFSACVGSSGPIPPLPFVPEGDDISGQIAAHRGEMYCSDLLNTQDRPNHTRERSLLMRLFTPRRLKENEVYMRALAETLVDGILDKPVVEALAELGTPFATLVVADLLGIPDGDRDGFKQGLNGVPAPIGKTDAYAVTPLAFLHETFARYIEERRAAPQGDVLSDLAATTFPDGSLPEVIDVVRMAVNLFAAGQETSVRLLGSTLRVLAEQPKLQERLRAEPELIDNFVEEVLRLDGPVKGTFRLAARTTKIEDVEIKAGTTVMVALPSINRSPARYERPDEIMLDRPKPREHIAFGRGLHTCPGAPLARVELRVMLEHLLARTSSITLSDEHHGNPGARRFDYAPTYLLRGLNTLYLKMERQR
jgi:cytochrome P450